MSNNFYNQTNAPAILNKGNSATIRSEFLLIQQAFDKLAGFNGFAAGSEAVGGTVNDYTVTVTPAPSAYVDMMIVLFKATHANTSASTLQINSLGTKALVDVHGNALGVNSILNGMLCLALYIAADSKFYLLNGIFNAPTLPATDSSTGIATMAAVAAIAFQAALPAQAGHAGQLPTTDGVNCAWSTIGTAGQYLVVNDAGTAVVGKEFDSFILQSLGVI